MGADLSPKKRENKIGCADLKQWLTVERSRGGKVYLPPPVDLSSYLLQFFTNRPKNWVGNSPGPFLSISGVFLRYFDFWYPLGSLFEPKETKTLQTLPKQVPWQDFHGLAVENMHACHCMIVLLGCYAAYKAFQTCVRTGKRSRRCRTCIGTI